MTTTDRRGTVAAAFAFAILLLTGTGATAQAPSALSDADIRDMTADRAYAGVTAQGGRLQIRYRTGGTMAISGVATDEGRYRIDAGRLCSTWPRIRNGQEVCQTVHRAGDGTLLVRNPDGSLNTTLTPLP